MLEKAENEILTLRKVLPSDLNAVARYRVEFLEKAIDEMDASLPPLRHFVLPGGHPAVSACHIARAVCRRVERRVMDMNEQIPVDEVVLRYINRLSDYLFVLGRKLAQDLNVSEEKWVPRN